MAGAYTAHAMSVPGRKEGISRLGDSWCGRGAVATSAALRATGKLARKAEEGIEGVGRRRFIDPGALRRYPPAGSAANSPIYLK